jgi:hypothetical protein
MKKSLLVLSSLATIYSLNLNALDLMVGININSKIIHIDDKETENEDIAKMKSKQQYSPIIGLRTEPQYFSNGNSNWGYFYQFDGTTFQIDTQEVDGQDEEQNLGTSIKGYSLVAVPTAYYHFNKKSTGWSQKVGIGVGAGYLNMSGNFKITKQSHPDYGQTKDVNIKEFGMAVGVFFEFSKKQHSIIIQNFAPTVSDDNYEYSQSNIDIMYRYKFSL